ncbi:pentapeptide repeat-containing protein [Rhodobacteraceae bacterium NNCM2]|nr:pentapeptide repeat-containing protein [Coraliihabitans acroporae]
MNPYISPRPRPRDNGLDHIAAINQNARTSWFGLLALLVFVGVTLLGHRDADFFAYGASTQLPLVGVSVPPEAFFWTAPVLTAALYCYLHLYLLNLWEALAKAPARVEGERLADKVPPSLITTAALIYRNWRRKDGCHGPRPLSIATVFVSILLVWGFGWIILGALWIRSFPLHNEWMTMLVGLSLFISLDVGVISLFSASRLLAYPRSPNVAHLYPEHVVLRLTMFAVIGVCSWARTEDGLPVIGDDWLYPANLVEAELTQKPDDWRTHDEWMADYLAEYCKRNGIPLGAETCTADDEAFLRDAKIRRKAHIGSLNKLSLQGRDLRKAKLVLAFLAGADLRAAKLNGAVLLGTQLQGAVLYGAQMQEADLGAAQIQGAGLTSADLKRANLALTSMQRADLAHTQMQETNLVMAKMQGAVLYGAQMQEADLDWANLQSADLRSSTISRASLRSVDFTGSSGVTQEAIDTAFGDARTILPEGIIRPCHWDPEGPSIIDKAIGDDPVYQAWLADYGEWPCLAE